MTSPIGHIVWTDLTVDDANTVRQFYADVIGWRSEALSMGAYDDYVMRSQAPAPDAEEAQKQGSIIAGICHARGDNAHMPAQWINYFCVADLDQSRKKVTALGGQLIGAVRSFGDDRFCIIQDPAGAVCGLYEKA